MLLKLSDWLVFDVLALSKNSSWASALSFFIYDSVKILLLLYTMIFVIGVLRTFIPSHKIKQWMSQKGQAGYVYAALFGAVTPFCSCSSIPIFLSFVKAGVPLGITFSFLVTSPLINEYLVVIMLGLLGWKITVAYVLAGLVLGIGSGMIIAKCNMEKHLVPDLLPNPDFPTVGEIQATTIKERIQFGLHEAFSIVKKIWLWILVGVGIGALIHNYVPQEGIQSVMKATGLFSVPIATVIGVPLYGSCAAIVPIAVVLLEKGIPLGTALAFMMAVSALSLPEAVMLRRAMKLHLILVFFGIVTLGIIFIGYTFNFLQTLLVS